MSVGWEGGRAWCHGGRGEGARPPTSPRRGSLSWGRVRAPPGRQCSGPAAGRLFPRPPRGSQPAAPPGCNVPPPHKASRRGERPFSSCRSWGRASPARRGPRSGAPAAASPLPLLAVGSCLNAPSSADHSPPARPGRCGPPALGGSGPGVAPPGALGGRVGGASRRSRCGACVAAVAVLPLCPAGARATALAGCGLRGSRLCTRPFSPSLGSSRGLEAAAALGCGASSCSSPCRCYRDVPGESWRAL